MNPPPKEMKTYPGKRGDRLFSLQAFHRDVGEDIKRLEERMARLAVLEAEADALIDNLTHAVNGIA